jgi:MEDS: MEthanogen/methylotroph, DcmR Sensory domain
LLLPSHPLIQFKRGDHICLFYRDEKMLVQTLAAYLAAGLNKGERCFCAQKLHLIPRIFKALELLGVDADGYVARGALEIHTEDEVYFPAGKFEPQVMMDMLERSIEDAIAAGFTGFRTAGEMSWALKDTRCEKGDCCDQLLNYEKLVQAAYPGKPAIGICQYPVNYFPKHIVAMVLDAHRMALEETMADSNHSTLTIRQGNYVVQGRGSFDVLSWGVEPTMEQALSCSGSIMAELASNRGAPPLSTNGAGRSGY